MVPLIRRRVAGAVPPDDVSQPDRRIRHRLFGAVPATLSPAALVGVRLVVFAASTCPFARLAYLAFSGLLGANPVEFVERSSGTATLVMLLVTLAVTPLRWLTGWGWPMRLRRMLGLFAFFYATLHVAAYAWLDRWFDLAAILDDITVRPYLTFGALAFVLLVPLAITSTTGWMQRLGGRNWRRLHWLVYPAAGLAIFHYWFHKLAKNDLREPAVYAAILGLLLGWRIARWAIRR